MEIDLKRLAVMAENSFDPTEGDCYRYIMALCAIMQADCASRQADAAERQTALLAQMAGALNILIDMMGDALADTPVPLDDGELPFSDTDAGPFIDAADRAAMLDIRTAKQVRS